MPEQQDAPYDPYIPSGQSAPQQDGAGGNARTQALQAVSLPCVCLRRKPWLFSVSVPFTSYLVPWFMFRPIRGCFS